MTIYFDDAPLPGYDHRVIVQEQIERKDASGETSAGTQNFQGWKPAILTITLKIRHEDANGLRVMQALWLQKGKDGTPAVWKLAHHRLLEPLNIKEARFSDFFRVSLPEKKKLWEVVFNMIEVGSTAALKQEREVAETVVEAGAPEGLITVTGDAAGAAPTTAEGWIEKLLHRADDLLGKTLFGGS